MNTLKDKVVLITGGGQGLGEAIARVLSDADAIVIPADIKEDQVKNLADELTKKGKKALGLSLNVTDPESIKHAVQEIIETYGTIDVLINNAGVDVTKSLDDISVDEWQKVIGVNLTGPFLMAKHTFSKMEKNGKGAIINIASTAAKRTWANASAYHASKWGLLGFSHSIHVEGREKNIKVTAVISGGMRTPFIMERFPDTDPSLLQDPKNVAETVKFVLTVPDESVIPEVMVIPMKETSWP